VARVYDDLERSFYHTLQAKLGWQGSERRSLWEAAMPEFDPSLPGAEAPPAAPEPWEAVGWSFVFPGLGQARTGHAGRGGMFAGVSLASSIMGFGLLMQPGVPVPAVAVAFCLALGLQLYAALDAHRLACILESQGQGASRRAQRDAWKALLLTRLLPGAGHIYEGRALPGLGFIFAAFISALVPGVGQFVGPFVVKPLACMSIWRGFRGRPAGPALPMWTLVGAGLAAELVLIVVTLALNTYVVRAYRSLSESMTPTFAVGDLFFADMRRRGQADVGDVIVFPYPASPATDFVKRVAGIAGDTLEFRRDGAWRNGRLAIRPPVLPAGEPAALTVAGEGHLFVVPPGQVFVIGDNLQNSFDSRFFGPIPVAVVHGRALKIYWPPAHQGEIPQVPAAVR
jgi:signal peptidase I